MATETPEVHFPLIDAMLTLPPEGELGRVGICTNTTAAGQVLNELGHEARGHVPVMGTLIVNRDGAERLILNSLVHPTLDQVILFGNETTSFAPSTNLLSAIMSGIDPEGGSNRIVGGVGSTPQYPNLDQDTLNLFRNSITVLPLFQSERPSHRATVESYLDWLGDRISPDVRDFLTGGKGKVYYDRLNDLVTLIGSQSSPAKTVAQLNPKDYQHLQPPIIRVETSEHTLPPVNFSVCQTDSSVTAVITGPDWDFKVEGNDEFNIAFTIMKELGDRKDQLTPVEQLLLGVALGQAGVAMRNHVSVPPIANGEFTSSNNTELKTARGLKVDTKFYYKVGVVGGELTVTCMAHETCEEVFELRSDNLTDMVQKLAKLNRFESYEMDILHRFDVGTQLGRAEVARQHGYEFMQDFAPIFHVNTENLPFVTVTSDTFLDAHRQLLQRTYTEGLTSPHPDAHKGVARTVGALVVLRNAKVALTTMPRIYQQGSEPIEVTRANYAKQLLRLDHDGKYSYGNRTRAYWGHDQLQAVSSSLNADPSRAVVVQRYDPSVDMGMAKDPDSGEIKYTHDPCLTHDVYWVQAGKLQSLHIARAHNLVNAYPENIYGLYDAYVADLRDGLGLAGGDMFVLSTRGNILMLSEEQRAKTLMVEPTKPFTNTDPGLSGPHLLASNSHSETGLFYGEMPLLTNTNNFDVDIIEHLRHYRGIDTIERAIDYLASKGGSHNNVVLSEYDPANNNPQDSQMVFLQANAYAGKIYVTGVFVNRHTSRQDQDFATMSYIGQLFAERLGAELGSGVIVYAGATNA